MLTIGQAVAQGAALLGAAGDGVPRLTAEVLLAFALGRDRTYLFAHPEQELSTIGWIHYGRYLHERMRGKPVQYITRRQEFYGREFRVSPAVLIPRPETEHLIERALPRCRGTAVDIGTGSGAIAVTLACETGAGILATDVSMAALRQARENQRRLGGRVEFVKTNLAEALPDACADLVVSNPPYVPRAAIATLAPEVRDHEPHIALFAGEDGMAVYPLLVAEAARVLKPGGWLVMETGVETAESALALLTGAWREAAAHNDLAGFPRVLEARWAP
ncbi:MAG: peptide chain release factor N(5)-glutamine methyltransferase [Acidobacteria bacterium]|nr:peptide chain release factor N(5)-glutamine methyltransferase [Acidobacteriota bacterium]